MAANQENQVNQRFEHTHKHCHACNAYAETKGELNLEIRQIKSQNEVLRRQNAMLQARVTQLEQEQRNQRAAGAAGAAGAAPGQQWGGPNGYLGANRCQISIGSVVKIEKFYPL